MISVQTVVDRMKSVLDAEGSDRYLFDQDFKPAINSSIDWLVSVFNSAFSDSKLSEEDLRELVKTTIWQTNAYSRIFLNELDLGYKIWSILAVYPKPTITPTTTPPVLPSPEISTFMGGISYLSSSNSAKRLTIEKWNKNDKNVFSAGNSILTGSLESYAYLGHIDYRSSTYNSGGEEIEIRPSLNGEFVGVALLKSPDKISSISDSIEFPETILDLLFQKALNFVAYKQGDRTSLYSVTNQDIATLVKLMV